MKYLAPLCFVLGGASGALLAHYFLKKRFDEELEKEIEDVKRVYSKETEVVKNNSASVSSNNEGYITSYVPTELYTPSDPTKMANYIVENVSEEEKIREGKELGMLHPGEDPDIPYLISDDTYVDTKENYSKDILHYYAGDQVIADEELEAIIHPEMLVGDNVPEYFDNLLETEHYADAIYIRNDNLSRDFEILYHEDSFFC